MGRRFGAAVPWMLAAVVGACETGDPGEGASDPEEELGIGSIDDLKEDGGWGSALTCKPLPDLPVLPHPEIVVSLDGLTLRLFDASTGFEKVFPIGPGAIRNGESLTPTSLSRPDLRFHLRLDKPLVKEIPDSRKAQPWGYAYSCKYWWKDPSSGKQVPVFAGLPFLRLEGAPSLAYAIHGPIDAYTEPSGGRLKRGYVSHGCIRMEAADVLELAARCKGRKVPVRVQRSVERRSDGTAVDLPGRWLLSECVEDGDCNFAGGRCLRNPWSARGFCTAACSRLCPLDRWGYPESFCIAHPEDARQGICTLKSGPLNAWCARHPGFTTGIQEPRFSQASVKADVCLPGSPGYLGAPCFTDPECREPGGFCDLDEAGPGRPGRCTLACSKTCPDRPGAPGTFCVDDQGRGRCVARCVLDDDCPAGDVCTSGVPRFGQPSVTASVCGPSSPTL
ncbi:L,D-transpeptidase [Myxococcota bacterium]|nr:L,D-transpeptidase [Myxococcota bacterium]